MATASPEQHQAAPADRNTKEAWEAYFGEGWERNAGRRQTRLFAKYFLETVTLPPDARTLLDVGCGMGDAAPEFHARYPDLRITGCDVSATAVEAARTSYGAFATFEQWGFDDIRGRYDVIYCSNTLDHFVAHVDIAARLLEHCRRLYVLVPFMETNPDGSPLREEPGKWHVATFDERTFDPLVARGAARQVRHWVHTCPIAWGLPPAPAWKRAARRVRDVVLRRHVRPLAEIFYEIESAR
jgi:SAM-dependent methyltransferase